MTTVLVAFASRHGATDELAHAIGRDLSRAGLTVDVRPMDEVEAVDGYSALVLGSAVYLGAWMPAARAFLERNRELIATRPTWLFSSGPVAGVPAKPFDASELMTATHARDHHLFGGRLERRSLTLIERLVARVGRPQEGDYREWPIATAWATAISRSLAA